MASVSVFFDSLEDSDIDALLAKQKAREDSGAWIRCGQCGQQITTADQRIEQGGAHEHRFENPAGIVFRIGCFRRAPGCRRVGEATLAWTWFPGHPWSVALCTTCGTHLGWSYGPAGNASAFHGLILDRLNERP